MWYFDLWLKLWSHLNEATNVAGLAFVAVLLVMLTLVIYLGDK